VVEVKTGHEIKLDNPVDKVMLSLTSFAAEVERTQAAIRVTDTFLRKAQAQHAVGAAPFGYRNVRQPAGHVLRVPHEADVAVLLRAFTLYADGDGLRAIVATLNREGAAAPGGGTWCVPTLHTVLKREIYIGRVTWNKTKNRNAFGERQTAKRPPSEWITYDAPDLAILPRTLWDRVAARRAAVRTTYDTWNRGKLFGTAPGGRRSRHLLSGLACCAACGGPIGAYSRLHRPGGARVRVWFYGCTTRATRGEAVCRNGIMVPAVSTETTILETFDAQLFDPRIVTRALAKVRAPAARPSRAMQGTTLDRDLGRLETRITRLVDTVETGGGDVASLVARLRKLEQEREELRAEQARQAVSSTRHPALADLADLERDIRAWRADRRVMKPDAARRLLGDIITKRMVWTPREDARGGYYEFTAECALDRLVAGILAGSKRMRSLAAVHGDDVLARREAERLGQRRPRGQVLGLRHGEGELGRAPLGRHVVAPRPATADVQEGQPERAADGGVGAEAGAEEAGASVHAHRAPVRPVDDHERRHRMGRGLDAVEVERGIQHRLRRGHDDREGARLRTGHDGVDRELLQRAVTPERRHDPERLGGIGAREHARDARGGGRHDGEPVAPLPADELRVDLVLVQLELPDGGLGRRHRALRNVAGAGRRAARSPAALAGSRSRASRRPADGR
jgi:hypothetical protein